MRKKEVKRPDKYLRRVPAASFGGAIVLPIHTINPLDSCEVEGRRNGHTSEGWNRAPWLLKALLNSLGLSTQPPFTESISTGLQSRATIQKYLMKEMQLPTQSCSIAVDSKTEVFTASYMV